MTISQPQTPTAESTQSTQAPQRRSRLKSRIAVIAILGALVAAGTDEWMATKNIESTDDAYTDGRAITIAPHAAGYVETLAVTDNQFVHKGDVLLVIDSRDYAAARDRALGVLKSAQGQLDSARQELALAKVTYPARAAAAQAEISNQKANLFKASADYRRQQDIPREATTLQDIDTTSAAAQSANAKLAEAQAQYRQEEPVETYIADAAAKVEQLQGQVEQAKADLTQAELNLAWCTVTAPQDGWITKRNVEQGNYVQVGQQLFSIVSPEVWVTANFKEDQLARMRPGDKASVEIDAYPSLHLVGHVDSIQLGSGAKFTAFPPENATGNFVKIVQRVPVKIVIDSGLDPNLPLPLNLSVEPKVIVK